MRAAGSTGPGGIHFKSKFVNERRCGWSTPSETNCGRDERYGRQKSNPERDTRRSAGCEQEIREVVQGRVAIRFRCRGPCGFHNCREAARAGVWKGKYRDGDVIRVHPEMVAGQESPRSAPEEPESTKPSGYRGAFRGVAAGLRDRGEAGLARSELPQRSGKNSRPHSQMRTPQEWLDALGFPGIPVGGVAGRRHHRRAMPETGGKGDQADPSRQVRQRGAENGVSPERHATLAKPVSKAPRRDELGPCRILRRVVGRETRPGCRRIAIGDPWVTRE